MIDGIMVIFFVFSADFVVPKQFKLYLSCTILAELGFWLSGGP